MKAKFVILLTGIYFFCAGPLMAQWQPDMRLTNDSAPSYISQTNGHALAVWENTVHVTWTDVRNGIWDIYYKRSLLGGAIWGQDIRLTMSGSAHSPSISVSGQFVHLVWADSRNSTAGELYYRRSADGGATWEEEVRLTNDISSSGNPDVASSGEWVHIAWNDQLDEGGGIYYKSSDDNGLTWTNDKKIATGKYPSIAALGQDVHVAWYYDGSDPLQERIIVYRHSPNGGISWDNNAQLSDDNRRSESPSVTVWGNDVHITWHEVNMYEADIRYIHSGDGGYSWDAKKYLNNEGYDSYAPDICASAAGLHVVWTDKRNLNEELYYSHSTDTGLTWAPDTRLTNDTNTSRSPHLAVSGTAVYVAWTDTRDGNSEIYFKRNPSGNTVGIANENMLMAGGFSVYPNPATHYIIPAINTSVPLKDATLTIFNATGNMVLQLTGASLLAPVPVSNLTAGIYFIRLTADKKEYFSKMVKE